MGRPVDAVPVRLPAEGTASPIEIVLVTSEGCHLCSHAREVLTVLAGEFRFSLRETDLTSAEGTAAVRRFRAPFPPILLVDGDLHGYGRISERKLRTVLARLSSQRTE